MSQHRHRCECDSCCGQLFSCGDRIRVNFILADQVVIPGIYIDSECDRLIWRRDGGNIECTPCSAISIIKVNE
ncbi:hypothetical protein [Haloplasma contractile]|uniref:Uncharacterized protein n=1 Tax=Haloplasma contractile SSD-17B TaxID=1033810 RepID=U2EAB8_9MOLU|nr:hypothetical protein [Haloplasma contractile]ERJ12038.1 hypothetical protein HLPCO_001952 [Haloplasma contractile SSD-17B]